MLVILLNLAAAAHAIRGLDPSLESRYLGASFTCDDSVTHPSSVINDDYCDCADGSDEPGTSACLDTKFYCGNKNHISTLIPSSRVNDGICDCCDGSDEWDTGVCQDTCARENIEYMKQVQEKKNIHSTASSIKKEWIQYASGRKGARKAEISEITDQIAVLDVEIDDLKRVKQIAQEYQDRVDAIKSQKINSKQVLECPENLEKCKTKTRSLQSSRHELVDHIEHIYSTAGFLFSESDAEEEVAVTKLSDGCEADPKINEIRSSLKKINLENYDEDEQEDDGNFYSNLVISSPPISSALPLILDPCLDPDLPLSECLYNGIDAIQTSIISLFTWQGWSRLKNSTISALFHPRNETNATASLYRDVATASKKLADAESKKSPLSSRLDLLSRLESLDFGHQNVWEKVFEECVDFDTPEYTYQLCFFDKVLQKPKNGGGDVTIGKWERWGNRAAGGYGNQGSVNYGYDSQMYTNGDQCWNGPKRSVEVVLVCGEANTVSSVSEPSKCEYEMKASSPAACPDEFVRDEL